MSKVTTLGDYDFEVIVGACLETKGEGFIESLFFLS